MRTFFLLLLLANLGFFAWANFIAESDTQSDPRPQARQIAPEKLRILPPQSGSRVAPAPTAPPAPPAPPAKAVSCLEWGGLGVAETARAAELLAPLVSAGRLTQRQVDEPAGWWVFISPRVSRQDAQKKAAELKARGVDDFFILQDEGPLRFALSLGVFKTEEAANKRLEALRARDVRTAQVGVRETTVQKTWFQIRPAEDALAAKLREMAEGFAGTDVRDCPAGPS